MALLLCAERALPAAALLAALQEYKLDVSSTRVLTAAALLPDGTVGAEASASSSFIVVLHDSRATPPSAKVLAECLRVLKPEGKLIFKEQDSAQDAARREAVTAALLLAGFVNVDASGTAVSALKPAWVPGASFSLRSRKPTAAVPAAPKAWTVSADDADEELMDEDDLLTEDDLRRPAPPASADDCEVGASGRKACANCTCGRAEGNAKVVVVDAGTTDAGVAPASACGSCYLGDAYRCSTCPHLGQPAFKPGEKVLLSVGGADV